MSGLGFFCVHPWLWQYHNPVPSRLPQSSQPQSSPWVCSLNPRFQHPDPTCTGRHASQAGVHRKVAWTFCVDLTLFCLPHTCCSALLRASESSFLSWLISPLVRGLPRVWELFLFNSSLQGVKVWPCFLLFPFHPTWLRGDLSCPLRSLRSSVSIQHALCENCFICRCIFDVFVGGGEFHIFLLHHLDSLPWWSFWW